MAVYEVLISTT